MTRSVSCSPPPASSPHAQQQQQSSDGKPPERSRNAKAQARHRAKRKAYIEQLEQTVSKLQTALALSPEQVSALPPPSARIRQLEHENATLRAEIDDLRRSLSTSPLSLQHHQQQQQQQQQPSHHISRRASIIPNEAHFDVGRREPLPAYGAADEYPKQLKRRRSSPDEPYLMSPDQTPSPPSTAYTRPPAQYPSPPYLATSAPTTTSPPIPSVGAPSSLLSAYALPPPVAHHNGAHHHAAAQQPHPAYSQPSPPSVAAAYESMQTQQHHHQQQQQQHTPRYTTSAYESVKIEDDGSAYLSPPTTGYFTHTTEIGWGGHHHQPQAVYVGDRH